MEKSRDVLPTSYAPVSSKDEHEYHDAELPKSSYTSYKVLILLLFLFYQIKGIIFDQLMTNIPQDVCHQAAPIVPEASEKTKEVIWSEGYRNLTVTLLSEAVKVKSESWDDEDEVGSDDRWNVFYDFSAYLKNAFPLVHSKLTLTRVNTHGLVFEWQGTDKTKKPILLMAHQDTVPVNMATVDQWTYPPWSGHYDGNSIWGRGASDCKSLIISELQAVTLLLRQDFVPQRTVILAFGFDEESKGVRGAGSISDFLVGKYGKDSIEIIVDEGGLGINEFFGSTFAFPGSGEKGYVDVNITLATKGGHSSVPPAHTGIGIISRIVTTLEAHPYEPELTETNPYFSQLKCAAQHAPDFPKKLKHLVKRAISSDKGRKRLAKNLSKTQSVAEKMLFTTSQAIDIIGGGVKVNALPEYTFVVVNHRIRPGSEPSDVFDHIIDLIEPIAKKFHLEVDAFGTHLDYSNKDTWGGSLTLTGINELVPAPVSPENDVWEKFSGTIRHVFEDDITPEVVVSPAIMTGNTDTRFMWPLSKNIYRFSPRNGRNAKYSGPAHTVDEKVSVDDVVGGIYWIHSLIKNFD